MSIRTDVPGDGAWHNVGTGPATVQVISADATGVEVMVMAQTAEPTGADGLVLGLGQEHSVQHFSLAQTIWAQVVQGESALVAVQPETA